MLKASIKIFFKASINQKTTTKQTQKMVFEIIKTDPLAKKRETTIYTHIYRNQGEITTKRTRVDFAPLCIKQILKLR